MAKTLSDLLVPAGNAPTPNHTIELPDKEKRNAMVEWLQGQPGQTVHIAKMDGSAHSYCLATRKLVKGCTHVATVTATGEFHAVKQSTPPVDSQGRLIVAKPQKAATKAQFAQITELRKETEELRAQVEGLTTLLLECKSYKAVRDALADTPVAEMEVA
tara:strand:+ start:73 stop:549 length:477 start_codon:yes stop_codon:yes gene_type:complete